MICAHCGAEASITAIGTMSGWSEVAMQLVDDKPFGRPVGRFESDGYAMDVDGYECSICGEAAHTIDKLVKVIHPWSEEWLRPPIKEDSI